MSISLCGTRTYVPCRRLVQTGTAGDALICHEPHLGKEIQIPGVDFIVSIKVKQNGFLGEWDICIDSVCKEGDFRNGEGIVVYLNLIDSAVEGFISLRAAFVTVIANICCRIESRKSGIRAAVFGNPI